MSILVKSDDIRSGRKAKARHGRLRAAQQKRVLDAGQLFPSSIARLQ